MEVTLCALHIIAANDVVTGYFRSTARPLSWFLRYVVALIKRFRRISTKYDRIDQHTLWHIPAKHDVINYFLSVADAILKKKYFCRKWTTGPRITKFGTEVRHSTLVNYTGIGASSCFRSVAIRHFYFFLHKVIVLLNGLTEFLQIW